MAQCLRSSLRRCNTITGKMLNIFDQGLLLSDIKERLDKYALHCQSKDEVREGKNDSRLLPHINIELEKFLIEKESADFEQDRRGILLS